MRASEDQVVSPKTVPHRPGSQLSPGQAASLLIPGDLDSWPHQSAATWSTCFQSMVLKNLAGTLGRESGGGGVSLGPNQLLREAPMRPVGTEQLKSVTFLFLLVTEE